MRIYLIKFIAILVLLTSCGQLNRGKSTHQSLTKKERDEQALNEFVDSPKEVKPKIVQPFKNKAKVSKFCKKTALFFKKYRWKKSNCEKTHWKNVRNSNSGDPLIWTVFGDESKVGERGVESTLIFCGVHGDEITPIKFCFDIIQHLTKEVAENPGILKGKLVAIAPIVNPDSFMKKRPTRTNKNSVDINRNFPTKDWNKDALKLWKSRYRRDKRRYPGKKSLSEPEVVFQVNLIKRYKPRKIISVHAPLTMLDYDGPIDHHTGGIVGTRANQLLIQMSKKARGYRIKNYPFFPGSLGNYAGNERNIPTYTLELPTSNPRKSDKYWTLFRPAIHSAIMHDMRKEIDVAVKPASSKATTAN